MIFAENSDKECSRERCTPLESQNSIMYVVSDCQEQFNFVLPSVQLARSAEKFANKLHVD